MAWYNSNIQIEHKIHKSFYFIRQCNLYMNYVEMKIWGRPGSINISYIILSYYHNTHKGKVFPIVKVLYQVKHNIIGPSVLRAPAEQTKVATVLGTFFHFLLLPPLFKTTEGVVVLFHIFAWAPKKK